MAGMKVANCASTWRNYTFSLVVQKGGNLIETEDMVTGGVSAAGFRVSREKSLKDLSNGLDILIFPRAFGRLETGGQEREENVPVLSL